MCQPLAIEQATSSSSASVYVLFSVDPHSRTEASVAPGIEPGKAEHVLPCVSPVQIPRGIEDQPPVPEVVQPPLRHVRGYNDFGDRASWARQVAIDTLEAGGHRFLPADVADTSIGVRCTRCLLDYHFSRLCRRSKLDTGCTGDLFGVVPMPLIVAQSRAAEDIGTTFLVKGLKLDSSHCLKHFAGALWCSSCGGILNLVIPTGRGGAPLLQKVCKKVASSPPYARGLVQLRQLEPPGHLNGGWPGPANFTLAGFV